MKNERGNAAITVLGVAVVTLLIVIGLIDIGIFFLVRARAQTAADAAALAAASELIPGLGRDPQGQARRFAAANGARLVECRCLPGTSTAQVKVAAPADYFMFFDPAGAEVPARAKAGIDLAAVRSGRSAGA